MISDKSIDEEKHLKEIVLSLSAQGNHYFSCQLTHLAAILRGVEGSTLPVLRFGYLIIKGRLSGREAVFLLTPLFTEARAIASGAPQGRLLSLLASSRDGVWLARRLREEMISEEERRKTNRIPMIESTEQVQEGEMPHGESGPDA